MLTRLTHAAIAFAMTVVVYQAYVLLLVPFIEPTLANRPSEQSIDPGEVPPPHTSPHNIASCWPRIFRSGIGP